MPRVGLDLIKNLSHTGIRSPERPVLVQPLYRLSYSGPISVSSVDQGCTTYTQTRTTQFVSDLPEGRMCVCVSIYIYIYTNIYIYIYIYRKWQVSLFTNIKVG
jgi:hypothetical protein